MDSSKVLRVVPLESSPMLTEHSASLLPKSSLSKNIHCAVSQIRLKWPTWSSFVPRNSGQFTELVFACTA